jgi:hypothetical protein
MILPEQNELMRLAEVRNQSIEQLQVLKEFSQQEKSDTYSGKSVQITKMDFFTLLTTLAHQQGVMIQSLKMLTESLQIPGEIPIRIAVEGEFTALLNFTNALMNHSHPIFIRHFSFQITEEQTLRLTVDLLTTKNHVAFMQRQSSSANPPLIRNPFCLSDDHSMNGGEADTFTTPLAELTMQGYMQLGSQKQALVVLPTGETVAVNVRDVIGKEKAVVKEILQDSLVVEGKKGMRQLIKGNKQ